MGTTKKSQKTRQRILEAALDLVAEQGEGSFSLEDVARHAGVSKGGLLYNFPNKHSLILAMVSQFAEELSEELQKTEEDLASDPHPNKLCRAFLLAHFDILKESECVDSGILAAVVADTTLLEPIKKFHENVFNRIKSESENPSLASICYFAAEGMRSSMLFGVLTISPEAASQRIDDMLELLKIG